VHGISWVFTWRQIEPVPGKFDWSKIDAALAASDAAGYTSIIRVLAGEYSPPWASTAFPSVHIPAGPWDFGPRPHAMNTVVPWSPSFVAHWRSVIAAYGAHFDSRHDLFGVQMPGGGHQGEMSITGWPGWLDPSTPLIGGGTLGTSVYTDAKDIGMWDTFIDAYRAAFPNHPTALDIDSPMGSASGGGVFQSVIAYAQQHYPGQVYYQQNGLRAQTPRTGKYFTTLHDLSASTKVGWQTGYGNNGTQSGADVMTSYQTAVASGASYFEALLSELTNPAFRTAVQYLSRYHR
jgi:hypothetical protein